MGNSLGILALLGFVAAGMLVVIPALPYLRRVGARPLSELSGMLSRRQLSKYIVPIVCFCGLVQYASTKPSPDPQSEVVSSAESPASFVDTRAGTGPLEAKDAEPVAWSGLWAGDAASTVTIAQDGVALSEGLAGEGVMEWIATSNGTYVLTHTTYSGDVAGAVETATFVVTGKEEPPVPVVVSSAESPATFIDTRAGTGPLEAKDVEPITWSGLWAGDAASTVTIAQDGTVLAEGLAGEGVMAWSATSNGTYVLTHATYSGDVAGAVETASFVVTGKEEPPSGGDEPVEPPVPVVVSSAESPASFVDTRAGTGPLEAKDVEPITWSGLWAGDGNASVSVTLNGLPFVSGTGEGVAEWTPTANGTYTFLHTTEGSGETLTATFNVTAKDISLAQVAVDCRDATYGGAAITPPIQSVIWGEKTLVAGIDFTLAYSGNVNAGTATITFTGINLYDGTYTTNFTIRPKSLTEGMVEAIGNLPYTGKPQMPKPTVTDAERGTTLREDAEYTLSYANNTAIGEGIVTVTGKGNYSGSIERMFVIEPSAGSELEERLGGAGKAESDDQGGWVVTATNDVDAANLPIEIPDNLGNVTIDLNGHDLVGGDGRDGARPSQDAGEDGRPAIRIVPGEGNGEPTVITIVNSGEDAIVQGGEGGTGNPSGEGAPAIEVAEDAREGVLVNIGEGVAVEGGDEFTPAIIGDVGTSDGTIVEPSRIHMSGEGTVTTPKSWKTGQKVMWKAVAAKGSVFAHWEGELVESLNLTNNELRNPSLQFIVPSGFDTNQISAVFISLDDDGLSKLAFVDGDGQPMGDEEGILLALGEPVEFWLAHDSRSYVKASVSGLPSGLKFDAKTMMVTGAPKKSGAYWVQVNAKNVSGYQWAEKVRMAVAGYTTEPKEPTLKRTAYYPLTVVSSDAAAGTVSGTGVYAEGKKASISAKPAKGRVFAGWYRDAAFTRPMKFASGDYRKASQSVVVPEVRYLFARFVAATTAGDPITGLAAKGSGLVAGSRFKWRVGVAVPEGDGIEYESASLPSASAAKLPSGVKFDAAKGLFTGVPTKAGSYTATVTVKNASKATDVLQVGIDVAPLDDWAKGSFNGVLDVGGSIETALPAGMVTLTVSAAGKISGKLLEGGRTWTLSAASFSCADGGLEDLAYYATVIAKNGKEIATNEIAIAAEAIETAGATVSSKPPYRGVVTAAAWGDVALPEWTAWQNLWKAEPWKTAAKPFAKASALLVETNRGNVTLKFAASGAVTAKGVFVTGYDEKRNRDITYSASCSTVLIPSAETVGGYSVFLYFSPKAGKFDGYAGEIRLTWDGKSFEVVE